MNRPWVGYIFAAIALIWLVLMWGEFFGPLANYGFGVLLVPAGSNARVASVTHGSSAEKQGVRVGDVVNLHALTLSDRFRLQIRTSPAGTPLTLAIMHGGKQRVVVLHAGRLKVPYDPNFVWGTLLPGTLTLLIIAFVVWRRPSLATAALVFYGMGAPQSFGFAGEFSWLPNPIFGPVAVAVNVLVALLPPFALLPFIVRFPANPQTSAARKTAMAADIIFLSAAAAAVFQATWEPLLFVSWGVVDTIATYAPVPIVLIFTIVAYQRASGEDRRRVAWVLVGLIVTEISYASFDFTDQLVMQHGPSGGYTLAETVFMALESALPIALGYSILRHRVLDIGFALNRTMVYGVTTALVVIVVSFIDWLTSRMLSEGRFALAVEAVLTIGFGVTLNWIHQRTERLVDRIVFRARHIAEKRIDYRVGALAFAPRAAFVDEAVAVEAPRIVDLQSAAVFRRDTAAEPFACAASTGWTKTNRIEIGDDSMLVTTLRSLERPIVLDDVAIRDDRFPSGAGRPVLAVPIVSQHELIGFALFGNRRDGALPDPEEVALLARLCHAAGGAYAMVEARRLREHAATLERSLATFAQARALP